MEPRWVGQRDNFRCGPVAVANALKWARLPCSWKRDKDILTKLCKTDADGTCDGNLVRALREASGKTIAVGRRHTIKIQSVIDHVNGGGAILWGYTIPFKWNMRKPVNARDMHYALLVDIMGPEGNEFFKFINFQRSETITWVHRSHYKKIFSRRCYGDSIFLLRKKY